MKKPTKYVLIASALLFGCGHSPQAAERASADPPTVASNGAVLPTALAVSSTCVSSVVETGVKIGFSTTLDCTSVDGEASCPSTNLTLEANTDVDSKSGASTSTWMIRRGGTTVVSKSVRMIGETSTIEINFGADFTGLKHEVMTNDGRTISGSVDGRELVPSTIGNPAGPMGFVDQGPIPDAKATVGVEEKLWQILDQATHDAPIACTWPAGGAPTGAALSALSKLSASLWHASLPGAAPASIAASNAPSSIAAPLSLPGATIGSTREALINGTIAPKGAPPDFSGSSARNSPVNFVTPDCQSCAGSCARQVLNYFIPFATLACVGQCFIPKSGGCEEDTCNVLGSSCDNGQTCCGQICCGKGTTCGNDKLGICCPGNLPVACGDRTGQGCFAAGSTCCGTSLSVACGPGQTCINVTATSASCCAKDHVASDGACCDQPACGGQCCDGGSCVNGQCCFGPTNTNGQCCGGFGSTACGPNCCENNDVCTSGNTCCPQAQVCGSSCCQAGQACVNGQCSGCPSGQVGCTSQIGTASFCCDPGVGCSPSGCCSSATPLCPTTLDCRDPLFCPGIR